MKFRGPKGKLSRRLGIPVTPKCQKILDRRPGGPGQHGKARRASVSDYGRQLLEKQKLKFQFMVTERALRLYFDKAVRMKGSSGTNLLRLLDQRLDSTLVRSGLVPTILAARQIINHRQILVNGKKVSKPGYQVTEEDFVELTEKAKNIPFVKKASPDAIPLAYIDLDKGSSIIKRLRAPERQEIPVICEEQMIVEWFSR